MPEGRRCGIDFWEMATVYLQITKNMLHCIMNGTYLIAIIPATLLLFMTEQGRDISGASADSALQADIDQPIPELPTRSLCFEHHECAALNVPDVQYPMFEGYLEEPRTASCAVNFLVNEQGKPEDIKASCSDKRFKRSAERGVSTLRFQVMNRCGQPCGYIGNRMEYPLEYSLEE